VWNFYGGAMLERKTAGRITMCHRRRAIRRALEVATLVLTLFLTSRAFAAQTVTVLYAGSLVGLMERSIGPAFKQQTGDEFRGHMGGSQELAKEVKEGALQGDVFISADPKVNALLSAPERG
jgi:molybdate/tungstate transport system substrate-binding protein